ncbi:hypothetical protein CPC16_003746 [Podila verticillata]|nr:hypothetical protein BGZ59_008963 [Podila verticillata]KAF9370367.1 hypothetical protein CPC16_003746 [Podila verticillata]KAI9242645.1 MAG: hypothetical protein BYD32DRAFT_402962 [Podila humilis]KFH67512.1 hypothetical protein MVEG_06244 [Podila verticillata NRRL 6337]
MDTLVHYLTARSSTKYAIALGAYMLLVRHLRYRRIRALQAKYTDPTLPLRNIDVAREIASDIAVLEFPYLNTVALEFALFKTYAIPSISKILAATRQFSSSALKRADDTGLILAEMNQAYSRKQLREILEGKTDPAEDLNDEKRSQMATERLNWIHGHYPIKQEDYLFTLALFILEPGSWIDRFEWRPLSELERNAMLAVWTETGENMKIQNIPTTFQAVKEWAEAYEQEHMLYAHSNVAIANSTIELLLSRAPTAVHPFGRKVVSALLTPRLQKAFNMPAPSWAFVTVIKSILWLRGGFIKYFMLPRNIPVIRTPPRANKEGRYVPLFNKYEPVYPNGYTIDELGPDKFRGKCPVPHNVKPSPQVL